MPCKFCRVRGELFYELGDYQDALADLQAADRATRNHENTLRYEAFFDRLPNKFTVSQKSHTDGCPFLFLDLSQNIGQNQISAE